MESMEIKKIDERCPWCGKKTVGQDKSGFKSCMSCDYNSDAGIGRYNLSTEERSDRAWKIYKALNCSASNPNVNFTCLCSKLKGHKGKHKDNEFPEFPWEKDSIS